LDEAADTLGLLTDTPYMSDRKSESAKGRLSRLQLYVDVAFNRARASLILKEYESAVDWLQLALKFGKLMSPRFRHVLFPVLSELTVACMDAGKKEAAVAAVKEFINETAFYKNKHHYVRALQLMITQAFAERPPLMKRATKHIEILHATYEAGNHSEGLLDTYGFDWGLYGLVESCIVYSLKGQGKTGMDQTRYCQRKIMTHLVSANHKLTASLPLVLGHALARNITPARSMLSQLLLWSESGQKRKSNYSKLPPQVQLPVLRLVQLWLETVVAVGDPVFNIGIEGAYVFQGLDAKADEWYKEASKTKRKGGAAAAAAAAAAASGADGKAAPRPKKKLPLGKTFEMALPTLKTALDSYATTLSQPRTFGAEAYPGVTHFFNPLVMVMEICLGYDKPDQALEYVTTCGVDGLASGGIMYSMFLILLALANFQKAEMEADEAQKQALRTTAETILKQSIAEAQRLGEFVQCEEEDCVVCFFPS
jgi:hypothetical protein